MAPKECNENVYDISPGCINSLNTYIHITSLGYCIDSRLTFGAETPSVKSENKIATDNRSILFVAELIRKTVEFDIMNGTCDKLRWIDKWGR